MTHKTLGMLALLALTLGGPGAGAQAPTNAAANAPVAVTVDTARRHQTIAGFGTYGGDTAAPTSPYLNPAFVDAYTHDLGASIVRVWIDPDLAPKPLPASADFGTVAGSLNFSADDVQGHGRFVQALAQHKLDQLQVYAEPLSPPGWMKVNGVTHLLDYPTGKGMSPTATKDSGGGWRDPNNVLKPDDYTLFGEYIASFALGFRQHFGVPVSAISVQNELEFDEFYESCRYDYDKNLIDWGAKPLAPLPTAGPQFSPSFSGAVKAIGGQFVAHGVTAALAGPESVGPDQGLFTASEEGYVQAVKSDPQTAPYLKIINIHGYGGDGIHPAGSRAGWTDFYHYVRKYGDPIWMTESSGESHAWSTVTPANNSEGGAISVAVHVDEALAYGNCSAFLYYLAISTPGDGQALSTANPTTGLDKTEKKYCAFKHFARYIRPGAVRVEASGDTDTFSVSAYVHDANKTLTLVMVNTAPAAQPVTVALPAGHAPSTYQAWRTSATESFAPLTALRATNRRLSLTLPAQSVVTLYGRG